MKPRVLEDFLALIARYPTNDNHLTFADWLDQNHEPDLVERNLPQNFKTLWHVRNLHKLLPNPYVNSTLVKSKKIWTKWSGRTILLALDAWRPNSQHWFDHGGNSTVFEHNVVVGEPYLGHEQLLPVARELQSRLGCPVSYSRKAYHNNCHRLIVWFSFYWMVKINKLQSGLDNYT